MEAEEREMIMEASDQEVQVVLETKDGHCLRAHASRVFQGWTLNGVSLPDTAAAAAASSSSSQDHRILLPTISTCGVLPTLELIYTGTISSHPITIYNVIDVIHASRFFILPHLEHLALLFFCNQSLEQLMLNRAKLLSCAVDCLSPALDSYIFMRLIDAMAQFHQDIDEVGDLSPQALGFYLNATRNSAIEVSESEYMRLRLVLMWCAHSISLEVKEAVKKFMPPQLTDFLTCSSFAYSVHDCELLKLLKPHRSSMKTCFQPWLCYLDLYRVHPEMLTRIVEPIGVIPLSYLTHLFRFHAMFFKDMLLLQWRGGGHHPRYAIQGDGCVIESVIDDKLFGFCTTGIPITSLMGIYEWDIVVEKSCSYLGIGFCSVQALAHVNSDGMWLGYRQYGWVLSCHGDLYHIDLKSGGEGKYSQSFCEGARVRVQVDVSKGTCSFTVDGKACGVAWEGIPSKIYPAVTMGYPGRVRIELARTEDKEKLLNKLLEVASETSEAT